MTNVIGSYVIENELSDQCSSKLYLVTDTRNGCKFIMKSIQINSNRNNACSNYRDEVSLQNQMDSPLVYPIYDAFLCNNTYNILSKYCRYGDLITYLIKNFDSITYEQRINIAYQMVSAINYIHSRGIVHFDIKPDNFLIYDIGEDGTPLVSIMDFGFSQQIWDTSIPWRTIGTNPYCPPEYFSHSDLNMSFDLFSLGVCLCVIFTGKYLYVPDCSKSSVSEESLNALTEEAKEVILSLTPENPEERISADLASQMPLFSNVPDYILRLVQGDQDEDLNSICESSSYSECNF